MGRKKVLIDGIEVSKHPLLSTWSSIKQRCYNENNPSYRSYGGRGVVMCERWRKSFVAFATDMGLKPTAAHSIDRIDPSGNYSPDNCRWATHEIQALNRRSSKTYVIDGVSMNKGQMAEYLGVSRPKLDKMLASEEVNFGSSKKAVRLGLWPSFFANKNSWDKDTLTIYIEALVKTMSRQSGGFFTYGDLIENASTAQAMDVLVGLSRDNSPLIADISYDQRIARLRSQ